MVVVALGMASCGAGEPARKVVTPVVDEVIETAARPALPPRPPRPVTRPPSPPPELDQAALAPLQSRPAVAVPAEVQRASPESEIVAEFIVCDGLGFYLSYGRLPGYNDWPQLFGGALLSRVPQYRARQVSEALAGVVSANDPVLAASRATHELGCAFG